MGQKEFHIPVNRPGTSDRAFTNTTDIPQRTPRVVSPNTVGEAAISRSRAFTRELFYHTNSTEPQEQTKKIDTVSSTAMTIDTGDHFVRGSFATIGWKTVNGTYVNMATTHPALLARMADEGPMAFEPVVDAGENITVDTIHLQDGQEVTIGGQNSWYRTEVEAKRGLIHTHDESPVAGVRVPEGLTERHLFDEPVTSLNLPNSIDSTQGFIYQGVRLHDQVPAVGEAFAHLGFAWDEDNRIMTRPVPSEFVRRLDSLRETDSDSGLYYPEVEMLSVGDIDPQTYLESYAKGKYPFAGKTFMHYDHDVPSHHLTAYMVHGEMAMDVSQQYSQAILGSDVVLFSYRPEYAGVLFEGEKRLEMASYVNDIFTTDLGTMGLNGEGRGLGLYQRIYDDMVTTLKLDGRLGDLQIVAWMQEQGMIRDFNEMQGEDLLQGILAHSRERFLQPQK